MNQKAFIIDDDQICQFITLHILKSEALAQDITCFYEAEKALQYLTSSPADQLPDLIFLDLNMPNMNGWQFLEAIRPFALQVCSKCRIYILTSSVDKEDQLKARDYPYVCGYFLKPLLPQDLETIRSQTQGPACQR